MTSAGYIGKRTNWADDVNGTAQNEERLSVYGEMPGKIVEFDAQKQIAKVQPLYKPKFNGEVVEMPVLEEVPVRFPRAGYGAITHPVQKDDRVTLRPQMRSQELYHEEDNGEASDARSFNLSDMEAHIVGGESLTDPIKNFDGENTHIRADQDGQYGIRFNKNGTWEVEGKNGKIYTLSVEWMEWMTLVVQKLGTEPSLVHKDFYKETHELQLDPRMIKLRGMVL